MKYYGLFRFTTQSWFHKQHLLGLIYYHLLKKEGPNHELEALNKKNLAHSRSDENLKQFAYGWKETYRQERQTSLCHTFTSRFVIHQCDEKGNYLPSKKEITEAIDYCSKNDPNPFSL